MKKHLGVLCLFAAAFAPFAHAATITVTITGTVDTGTDTNNNVFAVGNNLASQTFKLIYTFDDTKGTQSFQTCSGGSGFYSQATGTDSSATAQLYIPSTAATPFTFGGTGMGRTSGGWYALQYAAITCSTYNNGAVGYNVNATYGSGGYSGSSAVINQSLSTGIFPASGHSFNSSFDWRTTLFGGVANSSALDSFPFNIDYTYSGTTYQAYGYLEPSSLGIIGQSCTNTPSLTLDSTTYSNLMQYGDTTTLVASVSPAAAVSVGLQNNTSDGTLPNSVTTGSVSGTANAVYTGANISGTVTDTVEAFACNALSSGVPVYGIDVANFNTHQSNVSNATFTGTYSVANIATFLYTTKGSFLGNFYFDDNNKSGWYDSGGSGAATETYNPTLYPGQTAYNADGGSITPTVGDTGKYAAQKIYDEATGAGVNPKLLIVKLQVEKGLIAAGSKPSDGTLDAAEGCPTTGTPNYPTFIDQLGCAASSFNTNYTNAVNDISTWPYFWPTDAGHIVDSIQLGTTSTACIDGSLNSGCYLVSFDLNNAATVAQYNYTPFVQTKTGCGGGVCLFETVWHSYGW